MKYGLTRETKTIDANGSTITTEINVVDGKTNYPIRRYYEYREKVRDKKEEMTEYLKFTDSLTPAKLDPSFRLEFTKHGKANGYYYVIKAWTEVEY